MDPQKKILKDFIQSFLVPTLVGKAFVLYFGIKFSDTPPGEGQGYAIGLGIAITFTLVTLLLFAWKYKDHTEL